MPTEIEIESLGKHNNVAEVFSNENLMKKGLIIGMS
jgi:hypothetical protein